MASFDFQQVHADITAGPEATAVLLVPENAQHVQAGLTNRSYRCRAKTACRVVVVLTALVALACLERHGYTPYVQRVVAGRERTPGLFGQAHAAAGANFPCHGPDSDLLQPGDGNSKVWKCMGPPGLCIAASGRCDGIPACLDTSDEVGCDATLVAQTSSAVPAVAVPPAATPGIPPPMQQTAPSAVASPVPPLRRPTVPTVPAVPVATAAVELLAPGVHKVLVDNSSDPNWGCGLLGEIPGISLDGSVAKETQRLINGIKESSTFRKVSFWNWNLAPMTGESFGSKHMEILSSDFIFMPEQWGAAVVDDKYLRPAGKSNFLDSNGNPSPAYMATILLGSNEPDIAGSCMGNMFGKCSKSCSDGAVAAGDCPAAQLGNDLEPALPNAQGECNCWQFSHATGVGFWPLQGCTGRQPLPDMWRDSQCVDVVIENWKKTAAIATAKGYRYLSTPLVAENVDYAKKFIKKACDCAEGGVCGCMDASCGCPVYVGFHFYAYDCRPEQAGGYNAFQKRLDGVKSIMETFPFVKGAIINEVGMLNCRPSTEDPICVPNSGKYPASKVLDNSCPANDELPNGLGTFIEKIMDQVIRAKTSDGRAVVKGLSWFNANMDGGTYNLQLFEKDGSLNDIGEAYMRSCAKWGRATAER